HHTGEHTRGPFSHRISLLFVQKRTDRGRRVAVWTNGEQYAVGHLLRGEGRLLRVPPVRAERVLLMRYVSLQLPSDAVRMHAQMRPYTGGERLHDDLALRRCSDQESAQQLVAGHDTDSRLFLRHVTKTTRSYKG